MTGWLDADVILRYLLNDHEKHSKGALALLDRAADEGQPLYVAPFIVAELVYVLESLDHSCVEIFNALRGLCRVTSICFIEEELVLAALLNYRDLEVDFADALLMAKAQGQGEQVWTFNRCDFRKLGGEWAEPPGS